MKYLIDHYSYPGLKGLIAVGIMAMAMSTADSILNTVTVLIINDIIKPVKKNFKESMVFIRLLACLIGFVGVCMAMVTKSLLDLVLLSGTFFAPIVTTSALLAVFGFRSSTRAVLIGMLAGCAVTATWYAQFGNTRFLPSSLPGIAANMLFFMGSHYLLREKGGWVGIKNQGHFWLSERRPGWLVGH